MCTVSIFRNKDTLILSMNRDERRDRHEGAVCFERSKCNPIKTNVECFDETDVGLIYPTDKLSGGTWCGFNDYGVAMALLNRYQDANPLYNEGDKDAISQFVSRGEIIPTALKYGDFESIKTHLESLSYKNRQPFDLILLCQHSMKLYSWTGTEFSSQAINCSNAHFSWMISSSSVDADFVLKRRQTLFESMYSLSRDADASNNVSDPGVMPEFHLQQSTDLSASVFMSREHSHTKSFVQIVLESSSQENECESDNKLKITPNLGRAYGYYLSDSLLSKGKVNTNMPYKFSENETFLSFDNLTKAQAL